MLKVLSVGSIPPAWGGKNAGGVAAYHASLVQAMSHSVHAQLSAIIPLNAEELAEDAPGIVQLVPADSAKEMQFYLENVARCDVVLFHHIHHRWVQYHIRSGRQRPRLGFIHSWHPITFAKDADSREYHRERTQTGLQAVDALIFPSEHTKYEGKSLGLVWKCPDFVIHHPLQKDFTETCDLNEESRNQILFVGELTARKNPLRLLHAVSRIPGQHVTFLGTGQLASDIAKHAAEQNLLDRVRLLGSVDPAVVRAELFRSAVMCVPSCSESFGLVYIEALACGTPVIGFKATIDEIEAAMGVPCGVGLTNDDVDTLVSTLNSVMAAPWHRALLRALALERFSGERAVGLLVEALAAGQHYYATR